MKILFKENITLVLPEKPSVIFTRLYNATLAKGYEAELKDEYKIVFNGNVKGNKFPISRKVTTPNNFLPLLKGRIEATPQGCILFLEYGLFFGAKLALITWSLGCLLGMFLCFLVNWKPVYGGLFLAAFVLHFLVAFGY